MSKLQLADISNDDARSILASLRVASKKHGEKSVEADDMAEAITGDVMIDGVTYTANERRAQWLEEARECRAWRDQATVLAEIIERALRSKETK
jgi:hypothetical protein